MPDNRDRASPLKTEFLKERYDYELQRKDQLTDALNLPVGILSGLGGLLALMARAFTYADPVLTWLFVPSLILAGVAFFVCLVQLVRTYHRQTYIYLPLLRELEEWEEEVRDFVRYVEETGGREEDFQEQLRKRIIEAADRNTANNDERSRLLFWARIALFATLTFTAVAGFFFVVDQVRNFNASSRRTAASSTGSSEYGAAETATVPAEPRNPRG